MSGEREIYVDGMTYAEFHALPERRREQYFLRLAQAGATRIGFWRDCPVPACRRAKACKGFLTEAQRAENRYHTCFPPCTRAEESRRHQILVACRNLGRRGDRA